MKNLLKLILISLTFGMFFVATESTNAQTWRHTRHEYRKELKRERKEMREARRAYRRAIRRNSTGWYYYDNGRVYTYPYATYIYRNGRFYRRL